MSVPIVPVTVKGNPLLEGPRITLGASLAQRLRLAPGASLLLGFGRRRTYVTVATVTSSPLMEAAVMGTTITGADASPSLIQPSAADRSLEPARDGDYEGTIYVSDYAAKALCLPLPLRVFARRRRSSGLAVVDLGPLVGILSRERSLLYFDWTTVGPAVHTEAFVFSIDSIHWKHKTVQGYRPFAAGWRKWTYPLPHVVFDRSPGGWLQEGKPFLFRRLARHGVVTFNGAVGYKWDIHRRLWAMRDIRPLLPETRLIRRAASVPVWLRRWGGAYLKPSEGHRGKGIARVRREGPNRYHVFLSTESQPRELTRAQLVRFVAYLASRHKYVAQREIALQRIDGAVWDVRALAVRDMHGAWEVVGLAARLGRSGRIVSNLHQGGRPVPLRPLLEQLFGDEDSVEALLKRIKDTTKQVAAAVQRFAPKVGDLGIDLGIDGQGHIWLIEVNPKPGRQSFIALSPPEERAPIYTKAFEFARFLAGFGPAAARP